MSIDTLFFLTTNNPKFQSVKVSRVLENLGTKDPIRISLRATLVLKVGECRDNFIAFLPNIK